MNRVFVVSGSTRRCAVCGVETTVEANGNHSWVCPEIAKITEFGFHEMPCRMEPTQPVVFSTSPSPDAPSHDRDGS